MRAWLGWLVEDGIGERWVGATLLPTAIVDPNGVAAVGLRKQARSVHPALSWLHAFTCRDRITVRADVQYFGPVYLI